MAGDRFYGKVSARRQLQQQRRAELERKMRFGHRSPDEILATIICARLYAERGCACQDNQTRTVCSGMVFVAAAARRQISSEGA